MADGRAREYRQLATRTHAALVPRRTRHPSLKPALRFDVQRPCAYRISDPVTKRQLFSWSGTALALSALAACTASAASISEGATARGDVVKRAVKLFLQRSFDKLESITADDAIVYVQAPNDIPYAGTYNGMHCIRDFMAKFDQCFEIVSVPEVYYYLNESGSVFVACDFELRATMDAQTKLRTSVLSKVKVNDDGKVTKVAIISDTLAAWRALQSASKAGTEAIAASSA